MINKRTKHSVKTIIADNLKKIEADPRFSKSDLFHLQKMGVCRTLELGGHVRSCNNCFNSEISYNSCRDRHCTTCQGIKSQVWILREKSRCLKVPYFHVVFKLPSGLRKLCLRYREIIYRLLFYAANKTIEHFSKNPKYLGAKSGMTAVLHTWA